MVYGCMGVFVYWCIRVYYFGVCMLFVLVYSFILYWCIGVLVFWFIGVFIGVLVYWYQCVDVSAIASAAFRVASLLGI